MWSSALPCEKLRRTTFTPVLIRVSRTCGSAGRWAKGGDDFGMACHESPFCVSCRLPGELRCVAVSSIAVGAIGSRTPPLIVIFAQFLVRSTSGRRRTRLAVADIEALLDHAVREFQRVDADAPSCCPWCSPGHPARGLNVISASRRWWMKGSRAGRWPLPFSGPGQFVEFEFDKD